MIFIGSGSLLWRAVAFAVDSGHHVDMVSVLPDEKLPATATDVPVVVSSDVNGDVAALLSVATDNVVWLINSPTIIRETLINTRLRIYNIHNGPLPGYRGLPEVGIAHAILAGESQWSATLHEVDAGIDTGAVLDTESFDIAPDDRFQDVMLASLRACTTLFERNLEPVLTEAVTPRPASSAPAGYFGRKQAKDLADRRDDPNFERATALGIFAPTYRYLADIVDSNGEK